MSFLTRVLIFKAFILTISRTEKILNEHPELREQWTTLTPQGRIGQPRDLMGAAVFLLSEASSYVTGAGKLYAHWASYASLI